MCINVCLDECDELSVFVYDAHPGGRGIPSPPSPPELCWGKEVNGLWCYVIRGPGSDPFRKRCCLLGLHRFPESAVRAPSLRRHIAHPQ